MNRRLELILVTLLLLLAVVLRAWDLTRLPPGFNDDELAHISITNAVREGNVKVFYQVGDGPSHAGLYGVGNALVTVFVGDGLLGYRMFPFLMGLLTLAVLYALARRLFGPYVALVALGIMSVNLRAILLARTGTSETLVPLHTMLTLLTLAVGFNLRREVRFRTPSTMAFALLALLFGVTSYLHYTGLALGPLSVLFLAHLVYTRQPLSRRLWSTGLFVLILTTVIAGPYLVSVLREPSASEPYILWSARPRSVVDAVDGAFRAVGGVLWQGDARPTHNLPDLALVGPVQAILLIVGLIEAVRRWREPGYALLLMTLAVGWATDAWVDVDTRFSAGQVALPAVYILPAIGVLAIWRALRGRGIQNAWQPVAVGLALLLVITLFFTQKRLFSTWRNLADVAADYHANLGHLAAYLDRTPDDLPVSICSIPLKVNEQNSGIAGLPPHQVLQWMMHREDMDIRHSDCRSGLVFINAGAPMRFVFADVADYKEMTPELWPWVSSHTEWEPLMNEHDPDALTRFQAWESNYIPVDYELIPVDDLPDGTVRRLDAEERIRQAGGYWRTNAWTQFMPDETGEFENVELPVILGGNLAFAGYDPRVFGDARVLTGEQMAVVLVTYWRVDGALPPDLGFFVYVLNCWDGPGTEPCIPVTGDPLFKTDAIDVDPTTLAARDILVQVSYNWLKGSLPDEYALTVGAYDGAIDNPLSVLDRTHNNERRGDQLLLGRIKLISPDSVEDSQ